MLSGALECAVSFLLLILGYIHFIVIRTHQMQAAAEANEGTQLYFLVVLTIQYALHPGSLSGLYLGGEGAFRGWAAFLTDEVIPSLPLKLVVYIQDWLRERREAAAAGPDIPDLFERVSGESGEIRITTQKPKDGWRASLTVVVEGEFYGIARVESATGSRALVYVLRRLPAGSVMRGMYRYDPPAQE